MAESEMFWLTIEDVVLFGGSLRCVVAHKTNLPLCFLVGNSPYLIAYSLHLMDNDCPTILAD